MRTVSLMGSTGSVGIQALDVIRREPERFRVHALAAQRSVEELLAQVAEFRPVLVVIGDPACYHDVRAGVPASTEVMVGEEGGGVPVLVIPPQPARQNDPRINKPSKVLHLMALVLHARSGVSCVDGVILGSGSLDNSRKDGGRPAFGNVSALLELSLAGNVPFAS